MKTRESGQGGFTLIEVVLALGVVVFCLISVFGLLAVGVTSSHVSIEQTILGNVLTSVVTDLKSTPNPPVAMNSPLSTGLAQTSLVYGIPIPAAGTSPVTANTAPNSSIYLGPNGEIVPQAQARYLLSVWTSVPGINRQEIVVRLVLSWPAAAAYNKAAGSVEDVVALNRT